jgi:hypothetical protein
VAELKLRADLPEERPVHALPIDIVLADGWQTTVATVDSEFIEPEEVERRALLLAAAPDLLAALERAVETLAQFGWGVETEVAIRTGRAAIAKAYGEASRAS